MKSYLKGVFIDLQGDRVIYTRLIDVLTCVDSQGRFYLEIGQREPLGNIPTKKHIGGGKPDMVVLGVTGHTGTLQGVLQVHCIGVQVAHIGFASGKFAQGDNKELIGYPYDEVVPPLVQKHNRTVIAQQKGVFQKVKVRLIHLFPIRRGVVIELAFFTAQPQYTMRVRQ